MSEFETYFGQQTRGLLEDDFKRDLASLLKLTPAGVFHSYGTAKLQQMVLSPELPVTLEIQPSRKQREAYVMVKVVALKAAKALCKARYKAHWLEIELERKSVEQQGLKEGDTFEWIPNEEGVLRGPDIRNHPRREDAGETERTQRAFDELAKMVQQAGG